MQNIPGYGRPTKFRPVWYVAGLVFQGGVPHQSTHSLTGGGQVVRRDWPGRFQPVIVNNTSPIISTVGSGSLVSRFPFLSMLLGNKANPNG